MTMKYREFVVWSAFLLVSFFSSACLFIFNSSSDKYAYIGFLPLVFFLCSACFANVYKVLGKNIGVLCLHSVMAIRLVVTPVLMSISGDSSIFRGILADDVNYAIALLCYECVLVYVVLSYMASKSIKRIKLAESEYAVQVKSPNMIFSTLVWVMALYCVVVWFTIPTCKDLYKTIFEFTDIGFTSADYDQSTEAVGSLSRAAQTLFKVLFDIVRVVIPMYLLILFKRKRMNSLLAIFIGILFAGVQLLFISTTTARAIISAFLIIYFLSRLYPNYAKKIVNAAIVSTVAVIIVYFVSRFDVGSRYGDEPLEYLTKVLNAYFCGIDNVAAGNNLPAGQEAETFFASIYSAIPFNSTLFGLKVVKLQAIYNTANASYGQIPPMVIECAYYIGDLFAPLFSCICAAVAYRYGEKYAHTNSAWHLVSNLFLAILCAVSIVMYNESILLLWLLEWMVPMKLLSMLADRERTR